MPENVDRLWWTIGIVIIGAALVGIAIVAFPELLNEIIQFFKDSIVQKSIPTAP